jgi:hypothetical protein
VRADGTFEMDEVLSGDYSLLVTGLDASQLQITLVVAECPKR